MYQQTARNCIMSNAYEPQSPVNPPRPPAPRRSGGSTFLGIVLGLSLAINLLCLAGFFIGFLFVAKFAGGVGEASGETALIRERRYSGDAAASDKIAIVHLDGVLMEGTLGHWHRQIEHAAKDKNVKAVVVRINSPGGTITSSDDIHHRLIELRDGKDDLPGKPLVVSMGSVAASGGYYIAMPAKVLYAERTTITGSIGVYASFPNIKELGDKVGVYMNLIKAGRVKDSGSMFQEMKPEERYMWQEMVNHSYADFKEVVEQGRPAIKGKLEEKLLEQDVQVADKERIHIDSKVEEKPIEKTVHYYRQRADGGIWTAYKAKEFGLIDKIGYLEDAVKEATQQAGLTGKVNVVSYEKALSLTDVLFGIKSPEPALQLESAHFSSAAMPRLWYMAPQSELAGVLSALGR
jgi:protease-4